MDTCGAGEQSDQKKQLYMTYIWLNDGEIVIPQTDRRLQEKEQV